MQLPRGRLSMHTLRDTIIPRVLPAKKGSNSTASRGSRKKKHKQTAPWLPSSPSERRVLQRRRQPTATQPIYIYIYYKPGSGRQGAGSMQKARSRGHPVLVEIYAVHALYCAHTGSGSYWSKRNFPDTEYGGHPVAPGM